MTARRPREAPDAGAAAPRPGARLGLDWSKHDVGRAAKCRLCGRPAWLRDENGKPCHKVCAEDELNRRAAAAAGRYATSTTGGT